MSRVILRLRHLPIQTMSIPQTNDFHCWGNSFSFQTELISLWISACTVLPPRGINSAGFSSNPSELYILLTVHPEAIRLKHVEVEKLIHWKKCVKLVENPQLPSELHLLNFSTTIYTWHSLGSDTTGSAVIQSNTGPFNLRLAGKMLPMTQDYVTHEDMSNEERSFNPFLGKPETYNQSNF
jgi:hypothetical protein